MRFNLMAPHFFKSENYAEKHIVTHSLQHIMYSIMCFDDMALEINKINITISVADTKQLCSHSGSVFIKEKTS